jgi:hypothetical protein
VEVVMNQFTLMGTLKLDTPLSLDVCMLAHKIREGLDHGIIPLITENPIGGIPAPATMLVMLTFKEEPDYPPLEIDLIPVIMTTMNTQQIAQMLLKRVMAKLQSQQ